jgi:hypothetical protein
VQEERNEWLRQQDDYIRQLATAQADVKHQASQIHQLNEDAAMHRKAAEIWEEDRRALLDDRACTCDGPMRVEPLAFSIWMPDEVVQISDSNILMLSPLTPRCCTLD